MAERYDGYGMPAVDFSALGQIPEDIRKARLFQQQQAQQANRQRTLAEIAQMGPDADYGAIARKVLPVDPELGMGLARIAAQQQQTQFERSQTPYMSTPEGGLKARTGGPADPNAIKKPPETVWQEDAMGNKVPYVVQPGGGGVKRATVEGEPEAVPAGVPPGVNAKEYLKVRAAQLANVDDKSILEMDKAVQAGGSVMSNLDKALKLNETAYSGPFAKERGYISSQVGGQRGVDTEILTNTITNQALDQLKIVFGGMPTEGERKILIDVQGAASQAPEVRKQIYENAKEAVKQRTEFNKQTADAMRRGLFLLPNDQRGQQGAKPAAAAPASAEARQSLDNARKAIQAGKDPEFIKRKLKEAGIDPAGL